MRYEDQIKLIDERKKLFQEHSISEVESTRCFRLGKGDQNCMSCLITFSPSGITITGDITPTRNGSCSTRGYSINWFAGKLYCDYLAEKFLEKKWLPGEAADELEDPNSYWRESLSESDRTERDREQALEGLQALITELRGGDIGPERFADRMEEIGFELYEGLPGYGYDPSEVAWLSAIQQTFAELYHSEILEYKGARA